MATAPTPFALPDPVLRRASVVGPVVAIGALTLQEIARHDLSPVADAISAYGIGAYASVQTIALWALAIGSLALALRLASAGDGAPPRGGGALISVWGCGVALMTVINIDDGPLPTAGSVHETIATLSFVIATAAIVCVTEVCFRSRVWTRLVSTGWIVAAVGALGAAAMTEDSTWFGLTERVLAVTIVCWLVAVGRTVWAHGELRGDPAADQLGRPGPSVVVASCCLPDESSQRMLTRSPGRWAFMTALSAVGESTVFPSRRVISSPATRPASAAGVPDCTPATTAPFALGGVYPLRAASACDGETISTPR